MATSGSKDFTLDVADYVEEAFERCGLELRTGYDLKSATRSLNLMLAEWANRGLNQWTVNQKTITMVKDTTEYTIDSTNPTATIDVLDVFVRETLGGQVTDIPLSRMDDADVGANTLEVPFRFFPCLAAGLAYYMALKRAPEKVQMLKAMYEEEFTRALSQDEERASFRVAPDLRNYNIA